MLYKIVRNFIYTIKKLDCHDYISQMWNKFENTNRNLKIFNRNIVARENILTHRIVFIIYYVYYKRYISKEFACAR